jgi:putative oxidoreductase
MSVNVALLLLRLVFGAAIAAHGAQKLFGAFGGPGLDGTGAWLESLGFHPGRRFALMSALGEFGGGLLLLLGLFTPLGAAGVIASMLVAILTVNIKNGFFAINNGIELPFLYAVLAAGIAIASAGAYSLDARLGLSFRPIGVLAFLAIGVFGALATLTLRRPPARAKPAEMPAAPEAEKKKVA